MAQAPVHVNGTLRSHAEACVDAGLCALPAIRRGEEKRVALPAWKPYQQRLPSTDELGSWFGDDTGAMCIVCGSVSGNLEMIDFDLGGEAFESWKQAVNEQSPGLLDRLVIERTPSGGFHVVYRCAEPVSGNMKLASRVIESDGPEPLVIGTKEYTPRRSGDGVWQVVVTMIETRGEGGLFLCAPSDGYELTQGELVAPPTITSDERDVLLGCAWALDEAPMPVVEGTPSKVNYPETPDSCRSRPGDDFNERGDPREVLQRHGWVLVKPDENEHWRRPGKAAGTSATLKDGVFYVFSTNAPPFDAHKGYAPFAVFALLEHGGDFTKAASALVAEGYGSVPDTDTHGVDLSGFIAAPPAPSTEAFQPSPIAVGELVASFPLLRPPVIYGLLREGETMNVIASPKTGKSWLTLDLAIAVATGRPWLGRYETVPGQVLIIDNELHRETSAHRIPKVAQARSVAMREISERIFVDNLRGRLLDINAMGVYFDGLDPGQFKVIILDAFYRFMPMGGDENDNGTMANIYNLIDSYANRLGCCFVLIHHSTKGSQSSKSVTDVGAGAGAQSRATDTHLVLRPHEEDGIVVLDAAVRSWAPIDPTCLRWDFPVWSVDDTLDPAALKNERARKKREKPVKEEPPAWTPERFVGAFMGEPRTRDEIVNAARAEGLSIREAKRLITLATGNGLAEQEPFDGRTAPRLAAVAKPDGGRTDP